MILQTGYCEHGRSVSKVCRQCDAGLDALEKRVDAHNLNAEVHEAINASLAKRRAEVLAMPLPRNTCPGCFLAIYELAAEDGWCWDCNPARRVGGRADA